MASISVSGPKLNHDGSASEIKPDDWNEPINALQPGFFSTADRTFTYRDIDGDGLNPPTVFDTKALVTKAYVEGHRAR